MGNIKNADGGGAEAAQGLLGWREVVCEDALTCARRLPDQIFDFLYLDPPFFTNRDHSAPTRQSKSDTPAHRPAQRHAFSDRWGTGQDGGMGGYLSWLEGRLRELRRLLKPTGSLVLHLDWHAVHYAKVLCDKLFGMECFQNELIWHYQTGGASKDRFSRKHDTLLLYSKSERFYFDGKAVAIPRTEKAMKRARCPTGARIRATDTHKNPEDVLTIPALNPMATERAGYPTQKPVALLEVLIKALCPPGGTVGDFCCGSGTTLVAAERLGRRWLGCDVSAEAAAIARKRVESAGAAPVRPRRLRGIAIQR